MSPKTIAHCVNTMDPAAGGPPAVVAHFAAAQNELDSERPLVVYNLRPDREQAIREFVATTGSFPQDALIPVTPPRRPILGWPAYRRRVERAVEAADVVHIYGIWSLLSLMSGKAARKMGKPYVVLPAGMLVPYSLSQKKWKKKLGFAIGFDKLLRKADLLQATSKVEGEYCRNCGYKNQVAVVPHGVDTDQFATDLDRDLIFTRFPELQNRRCLMFLGRLHPHKGLGFLIEAFGRLSAEFPDWLGLFVGPDDVGHGAELRAAISSKGLVDRVLFAGPVYDRLKVHLLLNSDIFVLPSHSENFGIAVAEALAAGTPVITTQGTPWQTIEKHGCGWWIGVGADPLTEALGEAMALSDRQRQEMGEKGRKLAESDYSWRAIARQCSGLYNWLCGDSARPADVEFYD